MIGTVKDVVVLVMAFGLTILVHELGHFLVALKCGMVVDTFSIGFGPALWKRKIRGVIFKISIIPVGGYVAIPQLDPSGMAALQGAEGEAQGEESGVRRLPDISPWKKILVSLAGATGNVILAFLLALTIWASPKAITYSGTTELGEVAEGCAAYEQGLRPGSVIVAVNGKRVKTWYDYNMECLLVGVQDAVTLTVASEDGERDIVVPLVEGESEIPVVEGVKRKGVPCLFAEVVPGGNAEAAGLTAGDVVLKFDGVMVADRTHFMKLADERDGREVSIVVKRRGEEQEFRVMPAFDETCGRAIIGVVPVGAVMPWMHHKNPVAQVKGDAMSIVRLLCALATPGESKNAAKGVGGPLMIFAALWMSIKISFFNAVGFLRFLNVNLAVINLLPIPVLDGGHIMFSLYEGISRRKAHPTVVNVLINVFVVLIIAVFCILTFRDVDRFVPGARRFFFWRKKPAAEETTNSVPAEAAAEAPAESGAAPE
jgi:regulator of sigma E protease